MHIFFSGVSTSVYPSSPTVKPVYQISFTENNALTAIIPLQDEVYFGNKGIRRIADEGIKAGDSAETIKKNMEKDVKGLTINGKPVVVTDEMAATTIKGAIRRANKSD